MSLSIDELNKEYGVDSSTDKLSKSVEFSLALGVIGVRRWPHNVSEKDKDR